MENFTIDFTYGGISYEGIVTPNQESGAIVYSVQLESENQETFVEIIAKPPNDETNNWVFKCPDDEEPTENYDKKLLEEIGEAIEKNEVNRSNQEIPGQ